MTSRTRAALTGRRARAAAFAALAAAAMTPAAAHAGPPGHWTRVAATDSNVQGIALQRTADGVLHFAWVPQVFQRPKAVLLHGALAANAKSVAGPHTVFKSADPAANIGARPALVAAPGGGLRAFFAGTAPDLPGPYGVLETATAPAAGTPWTGPAAASRTVPGQDSDVNSIGAALASDGTPVAAWDGSPPGYHVGTSPSTGDVSLVGACAPWYDLRDSGVAVDAVSGAVMVAFNCGAAPPQQGVHVRAIAGGAELVAPSSRAYWGGQQVGISGRLGPGKAGIFVAYGAGDNQFDARPALWRVGASAPRLLGRSHDRDAEHTTLAPAPNGRLWVAWEGKDRGRLYATRTNRQGRPKGAIVAVKRPPGTTAIHRLAVEGSRGPLDLFALVERPGDDTAYWHQRIRPGLRVKVKKTAGALRFTVSDAGDPVKGARVKIAGSAAHKTNAKGKVKIAVAGGKHRRKVKVTKPGYTPARLKVTG